MRIRRVLIIIVLNFYWAIYAQEKLQYHHIKTDEQGHILPWYYIDPAIAYDQMIHKVWRFWDTMRTDLNGLPYYMNHQVWRPERNDPRGIGGDQIAMALESWRLLYAYTGDERIKENMRFMADYYISHSLSGAGDQWSYLPYPYNTLIYSGRYDGDMVLGQGYLQPDKAGSFAIELLRLFKMTSSELYPNVTKDLYLNSAIRIANTLARQTTAGDEYHSPMPFKVNANTSQVGVHVEHKANGVIDTLYSDYTTNWSGTMELWLELIAMNKGDTSLYKSSFDKMIRWLLIFPVKNNKWGPFFEDVPGWSDTQINAITFAQFAMNHKEIVADWQSIVKNIFTWVYNNLGNMKWSPYGVTAINEQTAYRVPGNSHTSRQAAAQLQYAYSSKDHSWVERSIRQLNWATYMVDHDGKNKYLQDENWLTDGYGDYIRHYLKSMQFYPDLAPPVAHILESTSIIQHAIYKEQVGKYYYPFISDTIGLVLHYSTYDRNGSERIRMKNKPIKVLFENTKVDLESPTLIWKDLVVGGILQINRSDTRRISIYIRK